MIDFHTHTFPDKIAARALTFLSEEIGGLKPVFDGTASGLDRMLEESGIRAGVVLPIATKPEQTPSINRFAIEHNRGRLVYFGSVHPDYPQAEEELERLVDAGIRGIKLHPEYQGFDVDDPRLFPLYEKIGSLGLITVFHAGLDIAYGLPGRARPKAIASVLDRFGSTPVVAAHFGGYMLWEEVLESLAGTQVHLDTSYSFARLPVGVAEQLVRAHGADRVLFGSDAPWSDPLDEIRFVRNLNLPDADKEAILDKNAARLLNI